MIHQYRLNGYNIVVDSASGSVHTVDDVAYDIIGMYGEYPREEIASRVLEKYAGRPDVNENEIQECLDDIDALVRDGLLFSEDPFSAMAQNVKAQTGVVKALCLHVAHTCNLNCEYCFASQGRYRGERALMDFETGKRALDFLIENSGDRTNLEVDFFGGEPLMNFDVVKRLVSYARLVEKEHGKNFRFTLTTNGVGLTDEIGEYLNKEMNNVVLSLDGRKEVHDRFRKDYAGNGSYDTIVPKFQRFVESRGGNDYYVRGTFTAANTDFTNDIFHMADLGFTELSMEPVVCAPSEPYALTDADLPLLKEQYEILATEMLRREKEGRGFTFYHYMIDLDRGPCVYKRIAGCGSGTEYMAVTPSGDLYPCHQFVGDPDYLLGNVRDGVTNMAVRERFAKLNVYSREECRGCWARLFCAGGCAANSYHATGSVEGVYEYGCELFKKRLECAIMIRVARFEGE